MAQAHLVWVGHSCPTTLTAPQRQPNQQGYKHRMQHPRPRIWIPEPTKIFTVLTRYPRASKPKGLETGRRKSSTGWSRPSGLR